MSGWTWDATKATVRGDSAARVKLLLGYAGFPSNLSVERGTAVVKAHDSTAYTVKASISPNGALDPTIWIPKGTQPGVSVDHHLCVVDEVTGRWHDFWRPRFTNGILTGWAAAGSMPANSVYVPSVPLGKTGDNGQVGKPHQAATASHSPLMQGVITPGEVAAGTIDHALCFSMSQVGPKSGDTYPAMPGAGGYSYPTTHVSLGNWLRLAPSAVLPSSSSKIERVIFAALKRYGMICVDWGSSLNFHGVDWTGGGRSLSQWTAAGVKLSAPPSSPLPITGGMGARLASIPWSQLQVLQPPPIHSYS